MKTIHNWVRKYGAEHIQSKVVRIETMKERDERKELKQRIQQLEGALADAHMDYVLEKAYFHVACDRMGEDPEAFKKKNAMTLCEQRRKSSQRGLR
jgi:maltooligosyltrehalose synthase